MPTYEYACSACGHHWEQVQRITEAPVNVCPSCAKAAAHRLISQGTNFILKGGGWYSDLYASPKGEAKKSETKGTTSSDTASASSTSEGSRASSGSASSSSTASTSPAPAAASSSTSSSS